MVHRSFCLFALSVAVAFGDESVPTRLKDASLEQFREAVQQASEAELRLDDFRVQSTGDGLRVDATFIPNPSLADWRVHLNLTRQRFRELDRQYQSQGFVLRKQANTRTGSQRGRSGLWIREPAGAQSLKLPEGEVPVRGLPSEAAAAADEQFCGFLQEHNAAGLTVAIARHGEVIYERGFGYADVLTAEAMQPTAEMRIASLSKPLTAVAVLRLQEQGLLKISDPVWPFLSNSQLGLPDPTDDRWKEITVLQLLQHTGGFDRAVSNDPMFRIPAITRKYQLLRPAGIPDIIRHQLTEPLDFDPGQRYAYSNFGYCLLGRVIESVSGQSYEHFISEQILQPCAMLQTRPGMTRESDRGEREVCYHMQEQTRHSPFWSAACLNANADAESAEERDSISEVPDQYGAWDLEVMDAHGGWVSTAGDLARFASCLTDREPRLLSESSLQLLVGAPGLPGQAGKSVWYGCGWSVRKTVLEPGGEQKALDSHNIWHMGALDGTSTLLVRRHDGFVWAVLFNTDRSKNGKRLAGLIDAKMHSIVNRLGEQAAP